MTLLLTVASDGQRLDRYLAEQLADHSRSEIQRWISEGAVLVNGRLAKASQRLSAGDDISVVVPENQPSALEAEDIPLDILYEDADLIAINKPAGLVVHPSPGHDRGTLVNAILHHCPDLQGVGGMKRPGIVHRLDKDTSGVILVAKNDKAHRYLQKQFKSRSIKKTYLALLIGQLTPEQGRIEAAIGRHPRHRKRMAVLPPDKGRHAVTDYLVLAYYGNYTLVEAYPLTGRTHQIRVHFAAKNHPVVGDTIYGPRRDPFHLKRYFLHAHSITFQLPDEDTELALSAPLPTELEELLAKL